MMTRLKHSFEDLTRISIGRTEQYHQCDWYKWWPEHTADIQFKKIFSDKKMKNDIQISFHFERWFFQSNSTRGTLVHAQKRNEKERQKMEKCSKQRRKMWTDIDKKISYSTRTTSLITLRIITSRLERFFSKNNVPQQVLVFLFQGLTVVFKTVAKSFKIM